MQNATTELEYGNTEGNFDAVVINDDLDKCYDNIVEIMQKWFPEASF
jgi:guanylate kinase